MKSIFIDFNFIHFIYWVTCAIAKRWTRFVYFHMDIYQNHDVKSKRKVILCDNIYVNEHVPPPKNTTYSLEMSGWEIIKYIKTDGESQ